jgi:mannitol/fructose-specific phosphotransferase system IIA component (Ntr-type)
MMSNGMGGPAAGTGKTAYLQEIERMTLGNLLTPGQIVPEMKATERWSAILEMIDALIGCGKLGEADREPILGALRAREETMSTGIGFGIAIPHASSDRVSEVVAAFGRSKTGIEFEALDNAPVRFVVMFVVPKDQFNLHLRTLAAIAKFLNDRSVREQLDAAGNIDDILGIFGRPSAKSAS